MLAEVLELADRHDSGSCVCTYVRVQVPSSARENRVENLEILGFPLFYKYNYLSI